MSTSFTVMRKGLDHDYFPFRTPADPASMWLPEGCSLAVSVIVAVQQFQISHKAPFSVPGGLDRPYPDLGNYSHRASGQTEGLWRLTDAIENIGIPASFVIETDALPSLADVNQILRNPRHALIASGQHATLVHTDAMNRDEEAAIIDRSIESLKGATGRAVSGWRSPYCSQSSNTLDLVAQHGLSYIGDFANDDHPFPITTKNGLLLSIPMNHFYSDLHFLVSCRQSIDEYVAATMAAASVLSNEATRRPAMLSLVIHPWIMGAPARINAFTQMLKSMQSRAEVHFFSTDEVHGLCVDSRGEAPMRITEKK